jgi:hypothetical protein
MTHVPREELIRWRDHGLVEDRERVLSHLASCKSCAQMYAELIRTAPATDAPSHFNPADFVTRGYKVRRTVRTRGGRSWAAALVSWKIWLGAISVAALAVFVISTGGLRSGPEDVSRGATIELVTPSGPTPTLSVLEWKSGIQPDAFRVELKDQNGTLLYGADTKSVRLTLPSEVQAKLVPNQTYNYTITALDQSGQAVTQTSGTIAIAAPTR